MAERVINIKINTDHYIAEACVMWCFDDRFSRLLGAWVRAMKYNHVDLINIAGGAKGLASPINDYERPHLLDQIEKSIRLHHASRVVLMVHSECGAYGKHFSNHDEEQSFYCDELLNAERVVKEFLSDKYPTVPIDIYYADFNGLVKVS